MGMPVIRIEPADRAESDRRLEALAAKLDTVPRARFDFSVWIRSTWKGDRSLKCGTPACALGWATAMPEFQRLGLRFGRQDGEWQVVLSGSGVELFNSFEAAATVFGLTLDEAEFLFAPYRHGITRGGYAWSSPPPEATPGDVARHIRYFIAARHERTALYEAVDEVPSEPLDLGAEVVLDEIAVG